MDLRTRYLGLELAHPLVLGASPLVENLDAVRRAEDEGAAAIVMRSLFEEQITMKELAAGAGVSARARAEAVHYLPSVEEFPWDPEQYLEQLRRIKAAVSVPVIASLNGVTLDGWVRYARSMDQAGADALELNLYAIGNDPDESGDEVEQRLLSVVRAVRNSTAIPLAVKLSPSFSSLAHFAARMEAFGADGLVLFNRFYQPDFDLTTMTVTPRLELSTARELRLRLRWLAALSPRLGLSMALSGGVHTPADVVKGLLAGAHAVQIVSEVLLHGVAAFRTLRDGLSRWLEEHGHDSVEQIRGLLNLAHCAHPHAYERANHMHVLNAWHPMPLDHARGVW